MVGTIWWSGGGARLALNAQVRHTVHYTTFQTDTNSNTEATRGIWESMNHDILN